MGRGKSSRKSSSPGHSKKASSAVSRKRGLKGKGVGSWLKGAAKKTGSFLYHHGSTIASVAAAAAALAAAGYGTYKIGKAGKDAIDYGDKKTRKLAKDAVEYATQGAQYIGNKASEGANYVGALPGRAGNYAISTAQHATGTEERRITEEQRQHQTDSTKRSVQHYEDPFKWTDHDRDFLPGGELYHPGMRRTIDAEEREHARRTFVSPDVQSDVNALSRQREGVHHQDEFFDAREWGGSINTIPLHKQTPQNLQTYFDSWVAQNGVQALRDRVQQFDVGAPANPSSRRRLYGRVMRRVLAHAERTGNNEDLPYTGGAALKHCPSNYGGRMTLKRLHHLKHCSKCSLGKGAHVIKALHSIKVH